MFINNTIWLAQNENPVYLLPKMANRHGLIAGATGTGKTVTLKVLAESFSDMVYPFSWQMLRAIWQVWLQKVPSHQQFRKDCPCLVYSHSNSNHFL